MLLNDKRIYIADDDKNVCEAIADILEDEGATVIKGPDGNRLFTAVAFGKPDLIITDLYMPEYDGFKTIKAIRGDLEEECPILVVTGHATQENLSKAKRLGASGCIAKPLNADELIDTVVYLLKTKTN